MNIAKNKVVSIDYTLTDSENAVIDSSEGRQPLVYLHGNGNLIPGLEKELEGKSTGASFRASIPPHEAYGLRDERKMQQVPRTAFAQFPALEAGMRFRADGPQGSEVVTIIAVEADTVTVDANHPLAGQTLHFDVTVRDVRDATEEEIAHGHVHGPGGHQH